MKKNPENRKIWTIPWSYRESTIIAGGFFLTGTALNIVAGRPVTIIEWPVNIVLGGLLVLVIIVSGRLFKNSNVIKWLSGLPAAISAVSLFLLFVLFLGIIPQNPVNKDNILFRTGLSHILSSYSFLLAQIYLLLSLGLTIVKRLHKLSLRNLAFLINHAGLWLTITAICLGAGDLQRIKLEINKDTPVFEGICENGNPSGDLGIALQLIDFQIEQYPPEALLVHAGTGAVLARSSNGSITKGEKFTLAQWNIQIMEFIVYGIRTGDDFQPVYEKGAAPAAKVEVKNSKDKYGKKGWISSGSYRFRRKYMELAEDTLLVMTEPEAKSYKSEIKIYTADGGVFQSELTVGKPVSINGWKIYQSSYDTGKGRWSEISVIELVKDPWLWPVYTGLIMLILGALYLIFAGKRKK